MVGESGIGYFYLSMYEQTIPGVWLWTPSSLQSRLNNVL